MEMEPEQQRYLARHKRNEVAYNRPAYREGKQESRVEVCFSVPTVFRWAACGQSCQIIGGYIYCLQVYTVNWESKYVVVRNVHALGVTQELLQLFSYDEIEE